MPKYFVWLVSGLLTLAACDNKTTDEQTLPPQPEKVQTSSLKQQIKHNVANNMLQKISVNQDNFLSEFQKLDAAQQYYFCAAFTMGAMSVSKPITASAMVNYFMGLGVVQHNRGIDENTYMAFDFGKNVFHFDKIVNTILQEKICENIIGAATQAAKVKKMKTKEINAIGRKEVEKIVERIKK
ncbi:MAG: hypothetical protein IJ099_05885 [Alphaproteobacteria bacterium]|nr:hypothetical protein [Alphaproteobacteria bacterium]